MIIDSTLFIKKGQIFINRKLFVDGEVAYECLGHENYFITKTGILYSIYVLGAHGKTDFSHPRKVAYGKDKDGYFRVVLSLDKKRTYIKIHTLMVTQFIRTLKENEVVNHKDGNKQNNRIENLEIVSVKENIVHAWDNFLSNKKFHIYITKNGITKAYNGMNRVRQDYPFLTTTILKQLALGLPIFRYCFFERKHPSKRNSPILCWFCGEMFREFPLMKDADDYFNYARGSTSNRIIKKSTPWAKTLKIKIESVIVSTIESSEE